MNDSIIILYTFVFNFLYKPTQYRESHNIIPANLYYFKNEISTPAATAEPITPEIFEAIQ